MIVNILLLALGFVTLIKGADWLVSGASALAKRYNVSNLVIGLTIVAFGTSLPKLATSVVAAFKKNNDIAVGNIIGLNIFNISLILGISSIIRPMEFSSTFVFVAILLTFDTLILFVSTFTGRKEKLDRWEAATLLLIFAVYTVYLVGKEL